MLAENLGNCRSGFQIGAPAVEHAVPFRRFRRDGPNLAMLIAERVDAFP